ncbi:glycosyltransferase [Allorhizobium terrae]|uniref:Glycosyltransferase n=1 Tax=Allorhizobium terrae TaxID=1848972 RepID=A0A4S3ZYK3_9HYPH|nr:glycosyltransferase [Allorhizobium terrae]
MTDLISRKQKTVPSEDDQQVSTIRFLRPAPRHGCRSQHGTPANPFGDELLVLQQIGILPTILSRLTQQALRNGTTVEQEFLTCDYMSAKDYYARLADLLNLPFLETLPTRQIFDSEFIDSQLTQPSIIRLYDKTRPPVTVIAPEARRLPAIQARLRQSPEFAASLAIATPQAIADAAWKVGARRRAEAATAQLFHASPQQSARTVLTARQAFFAGLLIALACFAAVTATRATWIGIHTLLSLLYMGTLWFRSLLLLQKVRKPAAPTLLLPASTFLPTYTVLVAIYRESAIVPQLIAAMQRLNWPASRLDIKLVCEEDDAETLAALSAIPLPSHFEIVLTPALGPRTKPKALTYALAGARGDYLVIYDAEDRPHPDQLNEAYAHFIAAPPEVACLQAPLIIANVADNWISSLFALEYAALFRGILPSLSHYKMPLPLGGTSNHFRTDILRKIGAWDPYNVTEDADLGLRLYRAGYRCETLTRATLEDAPTSTHIWIGQRSRWFKGWLQTWLVLMRHPRAAWNTMGGKAFLVFQLLIGGMLISALLHPTILIFLGMTLYAMLDKPITDIPLRETVMFWIDMMNILGSYLVFLALGSAAMTERERKHIGWRAATIPIYWLMTSRAAWKAVIELKTKPFFWNKTPHMPTKRDVPTTQVTA